jgi:hypothetical protein
LMHGRDDSWAVYFLLPFALSWHSQYFVSVFAGWDYVHVVDPGNLFLVSPHTGLHGGRGSTEVPVVSHQDSAFPLGICITVAITDSSAVLSLPVYTSKANR